MFGLRLPYSVNILLDRGRKIETSYACTPYWDYVCVCCFPPSPPLFMCTPPFAPRPNVIVCHGDQDDECSKCLCLTVQLAVAVARGFVSGLPVGRGRAGVWPTLAVAAMVFPVVVAWNV